MKEARPFLLAVDAGTSSLKSIVYDHDGNSLAFATRRYDYSTPQPGWAEASPDDWWNAFLQTIAELRSGSVNISELEVIALTGQMHTVVLLDENGEVIDPTILWLDRRAAQETIELVQQFDLPPYQLNSTYSLPKLLWLKHNQPDVLDRVRHIVWAKDYLRFRLTGAIMTDFTEAGGAALLDWDRMEWAEDRITACGMHPDVLPPMKHAADDAGSLKPEIASELGLNPKMRVLVGAGDVLALITGAPPEIGRVTCSLGTSSMIFAPVEKAWQGSDIHDRLYIYPLLPYRLLGGVSSTSGASLQWAWQALYEGGCSYDEAVSAALQVAPGSGGMVFLPFLAGERSPYWNDNLRGAFYGLTLAHTRAHMLRSVMEGVAYSLRYLLKIYEELGVEIHSLALAGGGTRTSGWPQMVADICNLPLAIYSGQATVTHALYAYAWQAIYDKDGFEKALVRTFHKPQCIEPDKQQAGYYQPLFEKYSLLADFSHEVLAK